MMFLRDREFESFWGSHKFRVASLLGKAGRRFPPERSAPALGRAGASKAIVCAPVASRVTPISRSGRASSFFRLRIEPATGVLAILALLTVGARPLFWLFVVAFNLAGVADLFLDYYHAVQANLPAVAGELGAAYAIPIIYVPLLMITHIAAFYMLVRPPARRASV